MSGTVHLIRHPLVQHKLTLMRKKDTSTSSFRSLLADQVPGFPPPAHYADLDF